MKRRVREEARRLGFRLTRWTTLIFYYGEVNFSLEPLVACFFTSTVTERNRKEQQLLISRKTTAEKGERRKKLLRLTDGKSFVSSSITPDLLETESISILQSTSNAIEQREDLDKRWLLFRVLRFTT